MFVFEGKYDLSGYPCRFTTLICADWVKKDNGRTVRDELLENLNTQWTNSQPALDWVFVIQNNPKPNHTSFLTGTLEFLTDHSHAFVHRDNAIVLHVNTAASQFPARSGDRGFTACILSPRAPVICTGSPPTVRTLKLDLRGDLQTCKDAVFREMGECIHAFTVRVPRSLGGVADDKTSAVPIAHVYATKEADDPRLCGGPVPASVKWTNDVLDELPSLAATLLLGKPLAPQAKGIEEGITEALREAGGQRTIEHIDWATCADSDSRELRDDSRRRYADLWDGFETSALGHLLHSLTCIGVAYPLDVAGASLHGSILTDRGYVEVVAIRGDTHLDCCKHYRDSVASWQKTDPVLVITCDHNNNPIMPEEISTFTEPDGDGRARFLDYSTLFLLCRDAADADTLRGGLNVFLPESRRII